MPTAKRSRVTSSRSAPGQPAPKSSQGGYGHDSERLTKSGRLQVADVKKALKESERTTRGSRRG